jgi:hypothetical protein
MAEKDVEALMALIKYCEEEAVRLASPAVVSHCLRMAAEELTNSVANRASTATTTDELFTKH